MADSNSRGIVCLQLFESICGFFATDHRRAAKAPHRVRLPLRGGSILYSPTYSSISHSSTKMVSAKCASRGRRRASACPALRPDPPGRRGVLDWLLSNAPERPDVRLAPHRDTESARRSQGWWTIHGIYWREGLVAVDEFLGPAAKAL
jgi:hypothetical protein